MKLINQIQIRLFFSFFLVTSGLNAQEISVHDPVLIKQNETFYLFCTGEGISSFSSKDLINWTKEPAVFSEKPIWTDSVVPNFKNHIWAPDILFHNNKYYLYYSVSAFGKNTSAIGVATNSTLNSKDKSYKWVDHGIVVQSVPNRDMWNAIDPNLTIDENNVPWLVFGSFWDGLKMVKLNPDLLSVDKKEEWYTVAKRKRKFGLKDNDPGDAALEAPFIFKKFGYYYLFLSWDFCCRGKDSTYKVVIGRSKNINGPYIDKDGKSLDEGGGSVIIQGNENWYGAGHNSVYTFDGKDYVFFHAYKTKNDGKSMLETRELLWDANQWPIIIQKN
jgi:beta-xylosidase